MRNFVRVPTAHICPALAQRCQDVPGRAKRVASYLGQQFFRQTNRPEEKMDSLKKMVARRFAETERREKKLAPAPATESPLASRRIS
jgi:hypothetical protein